MMLLEKWRMKVVSVIAIVSICLPMVLGSAVSAKTNEQEKVQFIEVTVKDEQTVTNMESELNKLETNEMKLAQIELMGKSDAEREMIVNKYKTRIKEKALKIQEKYGFLPVESNNTTVSIMSGSNDISLTDSLTYNSSTKMYCFTGDWNWVDHQWDQYEDLEDLVAARMNNKSGYQIVKSYAKTFDNYGTQTGYVDHTGNPSPQNGNVTKRFEDSAGVVFNLIDNYYVAHLPYYYTDSGRVTMYFKKNLIKCW